MSVPDDPTDLLDGPDDPAPGPRQLAVAGVALALLLVGAWLVRPWLHGLVYFVYTTPVTWLVVLLVPAAFFAVRARANTRTAVQVALVLLVLGTSVLPALTGLVAGETLGTETMARAEPTDDLAEVDADRPRIVTKAVAQRYAENTLNFPQYRIEGSDITVRDGTLYWSYALAPDGLFNHLTKRQHGTVLVDMTTKQVAVDTVEGDLRWGIGTAFYNNYRWSLLRQEFLVQYRDPFMVVHEGEQYVAVPYTRPEFHWTPVPHSTPEWAGVALVDSAGNAEYLSPEAAREHPVLAEQKLYPFALARERVAATKYRNGILNTVTSHEGEIEVAPVPGQGNDQPFAVATTEGIQYVVAVEPYGEAQGLKEVWTVDGRTGTYERYVPNQSLFGPRKAADYVRQAARTTDWNRFTPSEPIPVVVDGRLYWQVRVVPQDSSGVAYVAFVDARTSDVTEVESTEAVERFLRGERVEPGDEGGDERRPALVVQRVAPNGTVVEELRVYGDESIRVVQPNATNATATPAG